MYRLQRSIFYPSDLCVKGVLTVLCVVLEGANIDFTLLDINNIYMQGWNGQPGIKLTFLCYAGSKRTWKRHNFQLELLSKYIKLWEIEVHVNYGPVLLPEHLKMGEVL